MLRFIVRSPLYPMSMLILLTAFMLLTLMNNHKFLANVCFWIFILISLVFSVLIKFHNHKNPNQKIKDSSIIPPEFREMDEGQQWVTFKACRNVYIYYSLAIPAALIISFAFSENIFILLLTICLLGLGQYIVYWTTTLRLLKRI